VQVGLNEQEILNFLIKEKIQIQKV